MKRASVAGLVVLCAACALGQVRGGGARGTVLRLPIDGGAASPRRGALIGLTGAPLHDRFHHRDGRNSFWYGGWPYYPPEYDDSYQHEVTVTQAAPAAAPVEQLKPLPPLEPALYELRGNQWVRLTFGEATTTPSASPAQVAPPKAANELPPAVLVYRDGHTEELSSYSIMGLTIYTKADYYASGEWTRKIQLADLDLPATVKQNHDRGLKFDLPSGPNEVVLRP